MFCSNLHFSDDLHTFCVFLKYERILLNRLEPRNSVQNKIHQENGIRQDKIKQYLHESFAKLHQLTNI